MEASKVATRNLTSQYEKTGSLPAEKPILEDKGIKLFTDEKNAAELAKIAGTNKSLAGYLKAHLSRIKAGDYFALLGYIEMNEAHHNALQAIRLNVRDSKNVATCLGFGCGGIVIALCSYLFVLTNEMRKTDLADEKTAGRR